MRDDESVETVVSGHVGVSPIASAEKEGQLKQLKMAQPPKGGVRGLLFYEVSFLTCLKIAENE